MTCSNCKTINNIKSDFCVKCGNPLTPKAKQLFPEMIKPKKQPETW